MHIPTSVYAGMTLGDIVGCLIIFGLAVLFTYLSDRFLNALLRIPGVRRFTDRAMNAISQRLMTRLARSSAASLTAALSRLIPEIDSRGALPIVTEGTDAVIDRIVRGTLVDKAFRNIIEHGLGIPVLSNLGIYQPAANAVGSDGRLGDGWSSPQGLAGSYTQQTVDGWFSGE